MKIYDKTETPAAALMEGKDYKVAYSRNKNVGTASMVITGKGKYAGKLTRTFKITKVDLGSYSGNTKLSWEYDKKAVYTKNGAEPVFTLMLNGKPLEAKRDYTVTYKNNKKVKPGEASASITIKGAGNFMGTISGQYEVTVPSADTIMIQASDAMVPGRIAKLKTSLKLYEASTGKVLKAGTDYDRKFKYYVIEAGQERDVTADDLAAEKEIHVRVVLKGNYADQSGNAVKEAAFRLYTIKASTFKVDKIKPQVYTGKEITPPVVVKNKEGTALKEGVDYELHYSNNIRKGTAKVTITGIGNSYGGTKNVTFKITAANMSWAEKAAQSIMDFFSNLI